MQRLKVHHKNKGYHSPGHVNDETGDKAHTIRIQSKKKSGSIRRCYLPNIARMSQN